MSWLVTARLVRGQALALREQEFIEAVAGFGGSRYRIVLRHIVPNVAGTVVVQATFEIANAVLLLAALSFLGLGAPPPATNWGSMLNNGLTYIYNGAWWLIYPAGLASSSPSSPSTSSARRCATPWTVQTPTAGELPGGNNPRAVHFLTPA